ncbi:MULTISPECIES: type I-E CRISPR-associated protein Cas5/CasD [unclassified Methylococcus]|uniref:type I-E CRISPR-associated protein Cas5/CasD n=1 Tax=unclassified Methylococcus TaxID=2618889 RepID=UPI003D7E4582
MDILLLRFDAPLMSFGGVMVDQHGPTERFPGLSMLAGLLGNAMGYRHGDADALEALQARIEYAARWDVEPEALLDYHTVDLGQEKMREPGWTTRGEPEHRAGGPAAAFGTHQRYRHYWANGVMTLAVTLKDAGTPNLDELAAAIVQPARPLFLGRKTCLPAAPLLAGRVEAENVLEALRRTPRVVGRVRPERREERNPTEDRKVNACWPAYLGETEQSRQTGIYDRRDWRNQIHAGRRIRIEGLLEIAP